MALDEFILWVNADKPYKTAKDYIDAVKAGNGSLKMGGTGSKQEDQIITVAIEKQSGGKFIYVPFSWKDLTPVEMMALDEFVYWVNADTPYKTPKDYIDAIKKAGPNKFKMGGTGSKQEDQIVTANIEKQTGVKFTYIPYKGGGEVATQLVGKHVDSSVNNPIEAVAQWRGGTLRPLCVFDGKRMPYHDKVTKDMSWGDIPTCKESGLDVEYLMLRGIFMPGGVSPDMVAYYVGVLDKVRETPEWKKFLQDGAFNTSHMTGKEYADWVANAEKQHYDLMKAAGFLAAGK
jgi:putative tricarboxylic transport membrane protein